MIWSQTLRGRAFDLLNPAPGTIDFAEIADQLSTLHRYAGAAEKPVSVAAHTLIACDAAAPEDKAHVLLHDAHEAFIGDIITPTAFALAEILHEQAGAHAAEAFARALRSLKSRIDLAVWTAAGLSPPTIAQANRIKFADRAALITERRDFLAKPPKPWAPEYECIKPLPKKYRLRPAPIVAEELFARFKTYLPALRDAKAA